MPHKRNAEKKPHLLLKIWKAVILEQFTRLRNIGKLALLTVY
jgi:hypothetical protein